MTEVDTGWEAIQRLLADHPGTAPDDWSRKVVHTLRAVLAERDRYADCLRTVCHHLELPQSASGPCDDSSRYDRALDQLLHELKMETGMHQMYKDGFFRVSARNEILNKMMGGD